VDGARVALAAAAGYVLGRTRKLKLGLVVGGLAAGRRAGGPRQLLAQGTKLLGQSPEFARLTDEVRGRLLEAAKGAAVAVATRQLENLTERVTSRVGTLAETGGKTVSGVGGTVGGTVADVGKSVGGLGRGQSRHDVEPREEVEPHEELGEDSGEVRTDLEEPLDDTQGRSAEGEEDEEAPAPRRASARSGASGGGGTAGAALKRAGGAARSAAGKASAGRGGRAADGRQGAQ
jgi:hypothetical protein